MNALNFPGYGNTDSALAAAGSALDAYSEMLATMREQASRTRSDGYAHAHHTKGSIQRRIDSDTAYLSFVGFGFNTGIHGFSPDDLRSLAAACIATADAMEDRS